MSAATRHGATTVQREVQIDPLDEPVPHDLVFEGLAATDDIDHSRMKFRRWCFELPVPWRPNPPLLWRHGEPAGEIRGNQAERERPVVGSRSRVASARQEMFKFFVGRVDPVVGDQRRRRSRQLSRPHRPRRPRRGVNYRSALQRSRRRDEKVSGPSLRRAPRA